jgi:hypothetical protein
MGCRETVRIGIEELEQGRTARAMRGTGIDTSDPRRINYANCKNVSL